MDNDYKTLVAAIVKEQSAIIGPIALDQANMVEGVAVTKDYDVTISKDPIQVIDSLVQQYKALFGQISVEVCKEAVGRVAQGISADKLPASLR